MRARAQYRKDPRHDFTYREWLCDVIIRATVEPFNESTSAFWSATCSAAHAAGYGAKTGKQFARGKGLWDVIIRADVKAGHHVGLAR